MPANRFNGFTNLGIGLGLRTSHYSYLLEHEPSNIWFEIISENYMIEGGRPLEKLDAILEKYDVVQHGVSMYLGSAEPLNRDYLKKLKTLIKRTKAPWISDHLCWGSVDGNYTHDLLPLPYTKEAIAVVTKNIRMAADFLEVPLAIENLSSYVEYRHSEMTEWQFLSEVAEQSDCGILLDLNNIYVSSQNHGFNPYEYLHFIPSHRVAQFHLAGHSVCDGYLLDSHDEPVSKPVWKLYEEAIKIIGPTATLLEWDDNIPTFPALLAEANKAQAFATSLQVNHAAF